MLNRSLVLLLLSCIQAWPKQQVRYIMGTLFAIESPDSVDDRTLAQAFEIAQAMDRLASTYQPGSPISLLSSADPSFLLLPKQTKSELISHLTRALGYMELTDGAFHAAIASPLPLPSYDDLETRLSRTEQDKMTPTGWDLGGMLKGTAVDRMVALLKERHVPWAVVNGGGDLRWYGKDQIVTIRRPGPGEENRPLATVLTAEGALATSANDRRQRERDGQTIPHIESPRPVFGAKVAQVSVLAPTAELADVFATALFVAGPDHLSAWSTQHRLTVLMLMEDGSILVEGNDQHVFSLEPMAE